MANPIQRGRTTSVPYAAWRAGLPSNPGTLPAGDQDRRRLRGWPGWLTAAVAAWLGLHLAVAAAIVLDHPRLGQRPPPPLSLAQRLVLADVALTCCLGIALGIAGTWGTAGVVGAVGSIVGGGGVVAPIALAPATTVLFGTSTHSLVYLGVLFLVPALFLSADLWIGVGIGAAVRFAGRPVPW